MFENSTKFHLFIVGQINRDNRFKVAFYLTISMVKIRGKDRSIYAVFHSVKITPPSASRLFFVALFSG